MKRILALSVLLAVGSLALPGYAADKSAAKEKNAPAVSETSVSLKISGMT